jgi:hypothetical protein
MGVVADETIQVHRLVSGTQKRSISLVQDWGNIPPEVNNAREERPESGSGQLNLPQL